MPRLDAGGGAATKAPPPAPKPAQQAPQPGMAGMDGMLNQLMSMYGSDQGFGNNTFMNFLGPAMSDYGPQMFQNLLGQNALQEQMQFTPEQYDIQRQQAGIDFSSNQQQNALQQLLLGSQRGGLMRQPGLIKGQEALAEQLLGLSGQELKQQKGAALRSAGEARDQLSGQEAASGAIGTKGYRTGLSDIQFNLKDQLATIARDQEKLGIEKKQGQMSEQEALASNNDALAQIDIHSKMLGVDKQTYEKNFNLALKKMGLSEFLDMHSLYRQWMQGNSTAGQILNDAMTEAAQLGESVQSQVGNLGGTQ